MVIKATAIKELVDTTGAGDLYAAGFLHGYTQGRDLQTIKATAIKELVDTTGAGDLYAAGFLHGYTQGRDLQTCGDLGSLAAGLVIQQIGPRPRQNLRREAEQAGLL
ncbi:hypothetical protein EJ079_03635 [Mesorhizobium sp. M7A.F.Ce.TU.012.03.2.1]|nr:hypothetical protein EJ079_03635 [Mesorhizobium sp. M7A.F.Ce.TU.012.03.2.1]